MQHQALVELTNVYLKSDRGDQVFRDLSLRLEAGRSALITGPAGSGKTSLVELLVGLRRPDSGSVEVMGEVVRPGRQSTLKRVRQSIGGVGGIFGLIPSLTVAENITFPLVLAGERKKVRRERLLKALGEFSLLKLAGIYPPMLTRVENMLVQLARASIAHQPLLLIDEPLAGLDRQTLQRILDYLVSASLAGRSMVILSSEDLDVVPPATDRFRISNGTLT